MNQDQIIKIMISKFDIQKLQDLPIESVADALGLEVRRHKALCPFHDDSHPSLTFSTSRNRYRCYVCGARGGTIDLVMNTQHWSFYDSCKWLADKYGIYLPARLLPSGRKKGNPQPSIDTHYLEGLVAHPYLCPEAKRFLFEERHLDPRVVKWLGLTSISHPVPMSGNPNGTWFNAPSLLIPYRDIDGKLLSVQARYLGIREPLTVTHEPPRFQFPKGSMCSIYNLPILKYLCPGEPLFVTEGCSDCWSMLSAGHKAIAIPSATALKESDLEKIVSSVPEPVEGSSSLVVHIYPDNDKAGEALYNRLVEASLHIGFTLVRHQLPADCKDFSDLYLKSLIRSLDSVACSEGRAL